MMDVGIFSILDLPFSILDFFLSALRHLRRQPPRRP
jgi:hypothetical protein